MDSRQAKEILMRYRPGTTDAGDPEFAEALEQAKRDRELGRWFEQHRAFQSTVADRFKQIAVPQHLREKIVAEYNPARIIVWWQRPLFQALAAAAAIVLLFGLVYFKLPTREDKSFAAFRNRVVRNAQRGYAMDITTTNLSEIRQYLAAHQADANYVLPAPLEKLPGDGGAMLRWHNRKVSMVCFDLGNHNHNNLYLFVANRSDLPDAPAATEPQFTRIGRLTAASWSQGDKAYILAGPGDEQFIRGYLAPR
ncbi:MAG: hypothetical protein DME21_11920 [Verrucomicrobia bacterium]|nr:MAG: hypothetical protein DME21_11920 [Verrucomicrobiota bacterium]